MSQLDLFLIAAEPSADVHGYEIVKQLLTIYPKIRIEGILGPHLRTLPITCYFPMEKLQVMGFLDVIRSFPKILFYFLKLKKTILRKNPKALLCIDYPEFTLRLEKALKKKKYKGKIFHHICPTIWAWNSSRLTIMEKGIDHLFVIFPFEKSYLHKAKLSSQYVGHPLFEKLQNFSYNVSFTKKYELSQKILAIFPGSREKEIQRNLPIQLQTASWVLKNFPDMQIALSISRPDIQKSIEAICRKNPFKVTIIPPKDTYNLMKHASYALATSGTVTLELAFHSVPTIVTFGISFLDFLIAHTLLKIDLPFFCIVNIILDTLVFPELFGPNLSEKRLQYWMKTLITDPELTQKMQHSCQKIIRLFEGKTPQSAIAKKILFSVKDLERN